MKSIGLRFLAAISVLLTSAAGPFASTNPRYGGTLRIELQASKISLDPRQWKDGSPDSARDEKLAALVFDRLVSLDNYGRFQPQLAVEWSHDAAFKRWQFTLRPGVRFSDGTALNAGDVVTALQPLLPGGQQITANGNNVVVQSSAPMPDLLEELASGRYFVYRVQPGGTLLGTGPFLMAESSSSPSSDRDSAISVVKPPHLRFRANEGAWSGRPFVDAIDVTLGLPPLRTLFDLQLGRADLVELSPESVRRAAQENIRVWSSAPNTLYALRFDDAQSAASDPKLREALALSLDRQTIAGVLLQKQAEPASALLPQWLSGYAFLFNMEMNLERAKEIRATLPLNAAAGAEPLRLRVDTSGDLPKLLSERVAVNARQSSILIQLQSHIAQRSASTNTSAIADPVAGLHLFAWHYSSLSPRLELDSFLSAMNLNDSTASSGSSIDPEQMYARERHVLDDWRILPLVAIPEFIGVGSNVRDWMPARWGEWHLADVWLDTTEPAAGNAKPAMTMTPVPGAKP